MLHLFAFWYHITVSSTCPHICSDSILQYNLLCYEESNGFALDKQIKATIQITLQLHNSYIYIYIEQNSHNNGHCVVTLDLRPCGILGPVRPCHSWYTCPENLSPDFTDQKIMKTRRPRSASVSAPWRCWEICLHRRNDVICCSRGRTKEKCGSKDKHI